jgi:hypothetical protein
LDLYDVVDKLVFVIAVQSRYVVKEWGVPMSELTEVQESQEDGRLEIPKQIQLIADSLLESVLIGTELEAI